MSSIFWFMASCSCLFLMFFLLSVSWFLCLDLLLLIFRCSVFCGWFRGFRLLDGPDPRLPKNRVFVRAILPPMPPPDGIGSLSTHKDGHGDSFQDHRESRPGSADTDRCRHHLRTAGDGGAQVRRKGRVGWAGPYRRTRAGPCRRSGPQAPPPGQAQATQALIRTLGRWELMSHLPENQPNRVG